MITTSAGNKYVKDVPRMALTETSLNKYCEDKIAHVENITIPAYVVASYTNMLHTAGTFDAFNRLGLSEKWLRVHNSSKWPDYYEPCHVEELHSFFDCFLNMKSNNWRETPRVRLSILNPGGNGTINRPESQWPPATTTPERLYLHSDATLHAKPQNTSDFLAYTVNGTGSVQLIYTVPNDMEIIGNMRVHLWVEASGSNDDMDLSVSVQKLQSDGKAFTSNDDGERCSPSPSLPRGRRPP
ncbi:uncharacterized protein KD926_009072 [Aspergillus affinis]|uniref:uncharacterized protein n=1 Tax=Aspergillus affinis TaxID=1070780 RepID=UPI0022FEFEDF|nr:uncharacterized protein KD926_009072 [Aspergillus affinis]KAI9039853.1 hypothetical protein KD926_009072 [Aspergillus affinis]